MPGKETWELHQRKSEYDPIRFVDGEPSIDFLVPDVTFVIILVQGLIASGSPPARWGLLDFMSDARLILLPPSSSFFLAGPHLPALDRSEPRRDLTSASSLIAMVLAGLQPARVWALWSSPDFNRRESERCGPRRTSTGEGLSAVGLAGLQPARFGALWASPDFNWRDSARCGPRRTCEIRRAVGLAGL